MLLPCVVCACVYACTVYDMHRNELQFPPPVRTFGARTYDGSVFLVDGWHVRAVCLCVLPWNERKEPSELVVTSIGHGLADDTPDAEDRAAFLQSIQVLMQSIHDSSQART